MKFKSDIEVQAGLKDSSGSNGTSGQILSSNGTTVSWIPAGSSVANDVQNQVKAGVAINKGQAVYVTSADGTNVIVGLASNTSEATSSKTLGLLNATVAINGFADVVQIGKLSGLNTIGATVGDPVWLGTNGNLIYGLVNKPYAPAHLVYIGVVTRVNANNGEIFVTVQNGFELNEIHDVDLKTNVPVNGEVLGYNGTLWVNKTIASWLGYIPADDANVVHRTGDESIAGFKTFTNNIYTNSTGSANVIEIQRSGSFRGRISTESDGFGLYATAVGAAQRYGLRFDYGDSNFVATYAGDPNSPKFYVSSSSTVTSNSFYAPIYYDNNNTAYYLDPASSSNLYNVTANQFVKSGGTSSQFLKADGSVDSSTYVPTSRTITINGVTQDLSANQTWTIASGVTSFNTRTGAITLTSGDVTTALGYTPVTNARTLTINGVSYDLSADRSWTVTGGMGGSGTATYLPKFTAATTLADSQLIDNGTYLSIGNPTNTRIKWGGNTTPTLGLPFSGATNALWLEVNDGDTGGIAIDNEGVTVYGAGDTGYVFRAIDEDVYQSTLNVTSSTTFQVNQGANGGGYIRGLFNVTDYLTADNSARSPIFYDLNNTGYYLDPASTSNLNAVNFSTLYSNRSGASGNVITIDNAGSSTWPFIFQTSAVGNDNSSGFWTSSLGYPDMRLRKDDGTVRALISSWERSYTTYGLSDDTDMRAPIFYDSNDTSYYLDPNSTGTSYRGRGEILLGPNTSGQYIRLGGNGGATDYSTVSTSNGNLHIDAKAGNNLYLGWYNSSDVMVGGGMQALIYYDRNNTGYYLDPASTSNINALNVSTINSRGTSQIMYYEGFTLNADTMSANSTGFSYQVNSPFTGPIARFSTGGSYDMWITSPYIGGNGFAFRTRNGDNGTINAWKYPAVYGSVNSGGSLYATIYYDQDNSGYYLDPNSTSNLYAANFAGPSHFTSNSGGYCGSLSNPPLQAYSDSNNSAFFSFHKGGNYALNMGLDADNVLRIGGWSASANRWELDMSGNNWVAGSMRAPIFYDSDNTGYYINAAGSSNISSITVNAQLTSYAASSGAGLNCTMAAGLNGGTGAVFNGSTGTAYGSTSMTVYGSSYGAGIKFIVGSPTYSNNSNAAYFYSNTTLVGSISCTTTNTTYATSSDYRLKENIIPMESSIARVMELKPCRFNFIIEKDKVVDGFIAHEVQEVVPEAATGEKDEIDPEGNPIYQGIDQSKLVPLLTSALQEAISKIEELENRLSILENK